MGNRLSHTRVQGHQNGHNLISDDSDSIEGNNEYPEESTTQYVLRLLKQPIVMGGVALALLLVSIAVLVPVLVINQNKTEPDVPTAASRIQTTQKPSSSPTSAPKISECPLLKLSQNLMETCSNGKKIGSNCSFSCEMGFRVDGPISITCKSSLQWSPSPPICSKVNNICPPCYTGPYCKESTSWKDLEVQVADVPQGKFKALYAGYEIACKNSFHDVFKWTFKCECTDLQTKVEAECIKYKSPRGACEHALVQLVRIMTNLKKYPKLCDPDLAPATCSF